MKRPVPTGRVRQSSRKTPPGAKFLVAAMRIKTGITTTKEAGGKQVHAWNGGWEWKWFFDKSTAPQAAK